MKEPSDRGGKKPILKKTHFTIWYFLIAFAIIVLIQHFLMPKQAEKVIDYSKFKELLRGDKVKELTINPESINGTEKTGEKFQTVRVEIPIW